MHYLNQPLDLTFGFTSEETEFLKGYLPKVIQLTNWGKQAEPPLYDPKVNTLINYCVFPTLKRIT